MAFKLGLQDVSYDPDLHTGKVDFDFFDSGDSYSKARQASNSYISLQDATGRKSMSNGIASIPNHQSVKGESQAPTTDCTGMATDECISHPEITVEPHSSLSSGQQQDGDSDAGDGSEYGDSAGAEDGTDDSSAGDQSDGAPCSPGTERLQAVVRDVTAIQESLQRLRLSAPGASRAAPAPGSADPPSPDVRDAVRPGGESAPPVRARRPRPRTGCAQRKRWSSSLAEAALTQRQIEQLLSGGDSDSSSSDMVGASDSGSEDADGAAPGEVETWLGAAGSTSGSGAALTPPGDRDRPAAAAASTTSRAPPTCRLRLLAEAVRHLDRAKSRTAPPPAPRRPVRAPNRKNMSFTNEEVRQIDRHNRILLNKIVAQQRRPPARPSPGPTGGKSRGTQDQIRRENMILLQKIRTARPSRSVISGFHETPPPVRPILERGAVRHRPPWTDR